MKNCIVLLFLCLALGGCGLGLIFNVLCCKLKGAYRHFSFNGIFSGMLQNVTCLHWVMTWQVCLERGEKAPNGVVNQEATNAIHVFCVIQNLSSIRCYFVTFLL